MNEFEAIICIINEGYVDEAMEEAKRHGAKGGTVIKARGTAAKEAEQIFNITIQPEKEMVLILVPTELVDEILLSLYDKIGTNTDAQGIVFTLPVDKTVGVSR
ncbi:P-II family nitrogen regulator [bacterium]|jgi:nitrogen regulatory protein PII|nr:P-II family nitrogen regulator [bacterium]